MVIMNKALKKELKSTIKLNISKYISLIIIILLGVAFYVGMNANSGILQKTMIQYFGDYHYHDLKIYSVYGISNEEMEQLKTEVPEIEVIEGKYYKEMIAMLKNKGKESAEKTVAVHSYSKEDELDQLMLLQGRNIEAKDEIVVDGSMVELGYSLGDEIELIDESLETQTYKIVGIARNPQYISVDRGSSNLLDGEIDYFVYISSENFKEDCFSVADIAIKKKYDAFTDEYNQYINSVEKVILEKAEVLSNERKIHFIEEKTMQQEEAESLYYEQKQNTEEALAVEKDRLLSAENEINDAESKLMSDQEIDELTMALKMQLENLAVEINTITQSIAMLKMNPLLINDVDIQELEEDRERLVEKYNALDSQYQEALTLKPRMEEARVQIAEKRKELENANAQYEEAQKKAYDELESAYQQIMNGKRIIDSLNSTNWIVFDRTDSFGYSGYYDDTIRIANLSKILPLFFFIVASLVAATSVTRMVQEERKKMGILKSLGYSDQQVLSKYLRYALTATLIGLIIGIGVGVYAFPIVFEKIYSLQYYMPSLIFSLPFKEIVISIVMAVFSTTFISYLFVKRSTKEMPASLMHKNDSRGYQGSFSGRWENLWVNMSPVRRVAYRNIIFGPGRSLMTIIGICGCTALIIVSFSIRASVWKIIKIQFHDIFTLNSEFFYKSTMNQHDIEADYQEISSLNYVDKLSLNRTELGSVKTDNKSHPSFIVIPNDTKAFQKTIGLRSSQTGKRIDLSKTDGVVITQKLAKHLGAKKGDQFTFVDSSDISHTTTISDISENYIFHYIYMNKDTYQKIYGVEALSNSVYVQYKSKKNITKADADIFGRDKYSDYLSIESEEKDSTDILNRFSIILYIVMISAGLLAFIVLYNIAKINVSERLTEVATLKVLGYDSKEINDYINHEITILTGIGIVVGVIFAIYLTKRVIATCELDTVMFYQKTSIISCVLGVVVTIIFSKIISLFIRRDLKRISMTESLKEAD